MNKPKQTDNPNIAPSPTSKARGGKRAGAGRKKGIEVKAPEVKRSIIIQIKLTQAERLQLDQARGTKPISSYIRHKLDLE